MFRSKWQKDEIRATTDITGVLAGTLKIKFRLMIMDYIEFGLMIIEYIWGTKNMKNSHQRVSFFQIFCLQKTFCSLRKEIFQPSAFC